MANFVEICNVCARKAIIEAAKRIINSDKVCHSYSDLNFGVTFLEHSVFGIFSIIFPLFFFFHRSLHIVGNKDIIINTIANKTCDFSLSKVLVFVNRTSSRSRALKLAASVTTVESLISHQPPRGLHPQTYTYII